MSRLSQKMETNELKEDAMWMRKIQEIRKECDERIESIEIECDLDIERLLDQHNTMICWLLLSIGFNAVFVLMFLF